MSSRIKPSLHEVLHYPEESRRMLMQGFADAVDRFLERESTGVAQYLEHLQSRSPLKQP